MGKERDDIAAMARSAAALGLSRFATVLSAASHLAQAVARQLDPPPRPTPPTSGNGDAGAGETLGGAASDDTVYGQTAGSGTAGTEFFHDEFGPTAGSGSATVAGDLPDAGFGPVHAGPVDTGPGPVGPLTEEQAQPDTPAYPEDLRPSEPPPPVSPEDLRPPEPPPTEPGPAADTPSREPESHIAELAGRSARDLAAAVNGLSTDELEQLHDYETTHKNRKTVLDAIARSVAQDAGG